MWSGKSGLSLKKGRTPRAQSQRKLVAQPSIVIARAFNSGLRSHSGIVPSKVELQSSHTLLKLEGAQSAKKKQIKGAVDNIEPGLHEGNQAIIYCFLLS